MAIPDISTLSTDPAANTNIGGINIAENCPAANLNDACRWLAAAIAVLDGSTGSTSGYMPLAGGVFTGNPTFTGQGGYMHLASSAMPGGTVYYLPQGTALPSTGQDGDRVVFYS